MLDSLLTLLRGRRRDRLKSTLYLGDELWEAYRELMYPHDAPLKEIELLSDPTLFIGTASDSDDHNVPIRVPLHEASAMSLLVGGTGTGKTTFAEHLLWEYLTHHMPVGGADFKSGFYQNAIRILGAYAYRLPESEQQNFIARIKAINPFSDDLTPLNVCASLPWMTAETQAYEAALVLTRLFDRNMSAQMENILRNVLLLLIEMKLSLVEAPTILRDEVIRGILAGQSKQQGVQQFFLQTYPELQTITKTALRSRLEALLLSENMRCMLGADQCLNFKAALDQGDPLFVFLGKGPIPEELVDVFGSLVIQLLFGAGYAASPTRQPYQFIADEFFHLLDGTNLEKRFTTGLVSFRSFNFFLTLIMHQFSQVPSTLREAILANCDLMALFRTSGHNASYVGEFLPQVDPKAIRQEFIQTGRIPDRLNANQLEKLERLPNRQSFWYDRRKPYRALRMQVPDVKPAARKIGITERELTRFIEERGIGRSGVPRAELLAQITKRERYLHELVRPPIRVASTTRSPEPVKATPGPSGGSKPPGKSTPQPKSGPGQPTKRKPRIG